MNKCIHIIPRSIAKKRGIRRYFTGKECKNGGIDERITCSYKCLCRKCRDSRLALHRDHSKSWRERNPEKANYWASLEKSERKKRAKRYYEAKTASAEKMALKRESAKRYRDNNKHKEAMYRKKWNADNRALKATYSRNRRAMIENAKGCHNQEDIEKILIYQRGLCASCKSDTRKSGFHIDHIVPLALGGSNWPDNLQILCPACNLSKSAKDPIAWANECGRLL